MMQRPDDASIVNRSDTGHQATADDSAMALVTYLYLRRATFDYQMNEIEVTFAWSSTVASSQDPISFVGRLPVPQ